MLTLRNGSVLLFAGLLTACVHMPSGPSVMALPGTGAGFDQFRLDENECREYAAMQMGGTTPRQAAQGSGVESAAIGAGLGAVAGAVLGGGEGAAIGAGLGLLTGGLMGSGTGSTSGQINQQRYDNGYVQCMYAKGHRVPVDGRILNNPAGNRNTGSRVTQPQGNFYPPPPPAGNPPPPPPR